MQRVSNRGFAASRLRVDAVGQAVNNGVVDTVFCKSLFVVDTVEAAEVRFVLGE
jgi:hypothetical protein